MALQNKRSIEPPFGDWPSQSTCKIAPPRILAFNAMGAWPPMFILGFGLGQAQGVQVVEEFNECKRVQLRKLPSSAIDVLFVH